MKQKYAISDSGDILRSLLNDTLKEVMAIINAECGSLFLFDSDHKELVLNSFFNSMNLHLRGLRQKMGEGVAGKVADIKSPILVKDIGKDARFRRNGFKHYRTNSFISIPLYTSKGFLGLINLADKSTGQSFSEKDLEVAVTITKYVCLLIDINKQKTLLEKYASVGKLAAGIVHEINNPLDGVTRYTNILLEQLDANSAAREYLLEIKSGLSRMANITKSLLDFSYQVNFNSSQEKRYTDVHELIDESVDTLLDDKGNYNIRIGKRYKEGLPKILDLGLSHVFVNIVKNAMDAMAGNGTLEIYTQLNDSLLEIKFKDSGAGIPEGIREQIFEPFFTTKPIDRGTGLGLSICREIINKYEGDIKVESVVGKGSIFTVSLPKGCLKDA